MAITWGVLEAGVDADLRVYLKVGFWSEPSELAAWEEPYLVNDFLLTVPSTFPPVVDHRGWYRIDGEWVPPMEEEDGEWVPIDLDRVEKMTVVDWLTSHLDAYVARMIDDGHDPEGDETGGIELARLRPEHKLRVIEPADLHQLLQSVKEVPHERPVG